MKGTESDSGRAMKEKMKKKVMDCKGKAMSFLGLLFHKNLVFLKIKEEETTNRLLLSPRTFERDL